MARSTQRKTPSTAIPLVKPDRSRPDPSRETLLDIAKKRELFEQKEGKRDTAKDNTNDLTDPPVGRLGESVLWSISLAMLHFTFDVLVQHQYAEEISWPNLLIRALQAFGIFLLLFYVFHPHPSPSVVSPRISPAIHQLLFFLCSISTGCYLIYITNEHGYYAVMKQSPPLGCMWIWSVIELDLQWALGSLVFGVAFLKYGNYSYM